MAGRSPGRLAAQRNTIHMRLVPIVLIAAAFFPAAAAARPRDARDDPQHKLAYVGLALTQEASMAASDGLCTKQSQLSSGFVCFRQQETQYHGIPQRGGVLPLAAGLAATRVVLVVDIPTSDTLSLGARAGYSFGGGPTADGGRAFIPAYAEVRISAWLSERSFAPDVSPFMFFGGGLGQVDTKYRVDIAEDRSAPPPASQLDNPSSQQLDVWKKTGPWFVAAGVGAFIATGSRGGFIIDAKVSVLLPRTGGAVALSAGYVVGI